MDFWSLMIKKDDIILSLAEGLRGILKGGGRDVAKIKKEMEKRPKQGAGNNLYILLNAPSLNTQDISVLKGKHVMFVNRGFKHPLYSMLKPKYHVFVDSKMLKGVWPVSWLDDIWSMSPDTTIILPASWYSNPLFEKYRSNEHIYWMSGKLKFYNLGVSGSCFDFAIQQGYEKIYFAGFDATGIAYEMIKSSGSHFYGNDSELEGKSTKQFAIDLYMHSRHLHCLNLFAEWAKAKGYTFINITNGGMLDMFPREEVLPLLKEEK